MVIHSPRLRAAAPTLYFLGVLCLAVMGFVAAWPDMEATVFDAPTALMADEKLHSLDCPWVIAADEVGTVRARFTNPAAEADSFLVRMRVSRGFVSRYREEREQVTLQPHESREVAWSIAPDDAAYRRIVMVRVLATRCALQPARENACGVFVAGVRGVRGQWLFAVGVLAGVALVAAGALWWWLRHRPLGGRDHDAARRVGFLAVVAGASLATGMSGWWLVSHLLLIGVVIYLLVLLEQGALRDT
jgi:hypothetical protein